MFLYILHLYRFNNFSCFTYLGTYSNQTNAAAITECDPCPGGMYCETDGLTAPTGDCDPGYFCPEGSIYKDAAGNECPTGHYCPGGNAAALPCRNNSHVSLIQN